VTRVSRRFAIAAIIATTATSACEREARRYHDAQPGGTPPAVDRDSPLIPGAPPEPAPAGSPYLGNAFALSEGKRLYGAYNCVGCHAHGGGGIGPALMDDKWIYGSAPRQIYSVIAEGRPDGMPSFSGRVPDQQLCQIVAYVQSMSGQSPKDAAPSRDDSMSVVKAESRTPRAQPVQTGHR
jgi:cytochrome c oxidase cbb3-type subunit 3